MKKYFEWLWNFIVAAVIAGCILTVVGFSIFINERLYKVQQQVVELYEISIQEGEFLVQTARQNQNALLFIISSIDSLRKNGLKEIESLRKNGIKEQKEIESLKKDSIKRHDEIEKKYAKELKIVQKRMNEQIKKENKKLSYEYLKKVSVRIAGKKNPTDIMGWLGTGIIVKITEDFTYILTNKHVAPIGANIYVHENNTYYNVEVLKNSAFQDLSIVRFNGKLSGKKVIRGFANHKIQEKIYSVGMYLTNYYIYTEGTVAGISNDKKLLVNLPSAPGCSGSGIFNSKGEVVGLLYAGYVIGIFSPDTSKALCVPSSAIKVFLRELL